MRLFKILPVLSYRLPKSFPKHRRRIRTCLFNSTLEQESFKMARKPGTRAGAEFVLFDVVYEDGSQRSNRRVPSAVLGGAERDGTRRRFYRRAGPSYRNEIWAAGGRYKKRPPLRQQGSAPTRSSPQKGLSHSSPSRGGQT